MLDGFRFLDEADEGARFAVPSTAGTPPRDQFAATPNLEGLPDSAFSIGSKSIQNDRNADRIQRAHALGTLTRSAPPV